MRSGQLSPKLERMTIKNQGHHFHHTAASASMDASNGTSVSVSSQPSRAALPNRRMWAAQMLGLGVASACAAVGSAAWAQAAPSLGAASGPQPAGVDKLEKRRITIALSNRAALTYLPLTVADQLGYFQAEGLDVELLEVPSLVRAQQLASSGGADMVSGWVENTLALQAKGQAFTAFVLQGRAPQIALGLSTKTLPKASTIIDLRGKKIGVMAPGTPTHTVAYRVLRRAGLRVDEMNFVSVGTPTGALAALRAGQIDALSYTDPLLTQLEQRGELRLVADMRTVRATQQLCGGDMPASCLYAPPELLQKAPNTTQAVAHAMVHALKWLQTAGVSDLMKTVPESYFAGDRALYLAAFARMRDAIALDGLIPEAGVLNTLAAMREAEPELRAEPIDPAKCFTNVFALKAKQRYKL